ncbi:MAG TPA: GIY-YIG nuclease family protein [Victivallales bacterium]|nr:GIY-YIG nuclease family protein [Victivallales bacterium]
MPCDVYILYSASLNKFYVGISQFAMKRLSQHRKGQSKWTSSADDWIKVWNTCLKDHLEARVLEKKIKTRGARRFLKDIDVAVPPQAG